ncbi:Dot/Icm T4SS effector VpdC [Legionella lytica]|nr:Dot/Icm T4SS effector VpdC [Legionella lytica]
MTPQHVISQLLESDTKYPKNLDLLKKIIITAQLGRLQINGLPPDNKISLASYLFDNENIMFDFTRLCEEKRKLFTQWLLGPHQKDKTRAHFRGATVNEYRGFTAEAFLNWWGIVKSWINKRYSEYWKITDLNISLNYQLIGVEMCHGKHGILIGFDQFLVPGSDTKYHDPNDLQKAPLGNTKRVFITEQLVDQLIHKDIQHLEFESICKNPHPHSVYVANLQERLAQMYDYRSTQRYLAHPPWYVRLWNWIIPGSSEANKTKSSVVKENHLISLYQDETVQIDYYSKTQEILVREKRPDIDNIVYCGGGAKIYGHVGFWKALNDAQIHPTKFAGSSAGAIMALLCYLGYTANEITEFFKSFKQEHLVHFDIDINGMSDPRSLKTALDYAITYKLNQIVSQYGIPYPQGKITFATLEAIRQRVPDCGLGQELVVTATNKRLGKTRYFSLQRSPDFEVSEAVKISASFPIVYRSTVLDGDEHNDGGILTNFPTEAFFDDHSTLLESEYGNNLKVLAVQFDNGTERTAIDRVMERVYKEHFFMNWGYRVLTGVDDPASGWEQDRLKLRKYSSQSIVINVDNVSTTSFTVDDESRNKMIQAGYDATISYLKMRYICKEDGGFENDEYMYSKYTCLGDLLSYCCYRDEFDWFERINRIAVEANIPNKAGILSQINELRSLYFQAKTKTTPKNDRPIEDNSLTFFGNAIPQEPQPLIDNENYKVLLAVYPVFLMLTPDLLKDNADKRLFEEARHALALRTPFASLEYLVKLKQPINVMLHIVINLFSELRENPRQEVYDAFAEVIKAFKSNRSVYKNEFYAHWNLSFTQSLRVLHVLNNYTDLVATGLLNSLSRGDEPLQKVVNGEYCEDNEDFSDEMQPLTSFSA